MRYRSLLNTLFCRLLVAVVVLSVVSAEGRLSLGAEIPFHPQVTTANLSGVVVDETEAVVVNARITVLNDSTGFQRQSLTNGEGYFVISLLPPGEYTLIAEMPGFATVTVNDITLLTSVNNSVQIVLRPKPINEQINVTTSTGISAFENRIDISNATVKHTVTNEQVISLPVLTSTLGRNTLGVLPFLLPGVTPVAPLGSAQADTNRFGHQMSINGSRTSSISFNFEGGDNNDHGLSGSSAPFPNPDVLQEFTILTSSYQADLGRSSGGIVNAVAKSGTTEYHGNGRFFLINEALNARGFFDPRTPLDRVKTFGGQVGGPAKLPLIKDSFFFVDYEGARSNRETLSNIIVLSRAEREGDLSDRNFLIRLPGLPRPPPFPQFFDNNKIPSTVISPTAREYLSRFIPLPNDGERNFIQLLPTTFRNDQFTARFDQKLSQSDNLSFTYFFIDSYIESGTAILPVGSKILSTNRSNSFVLRETHILSSQTVNQFTGALIRFVDDGERSAPGATGVAPAELGFVGIRPQSVESLGVPSINITGTNARIATGGDILFARTTWQLKDDLSHNRASHAYKLGGEVRGFLENTRIGNNNGSFFFSGFAALGSNDPVANFLLGFPNSYIQTTGSNRYPRQTAWYFYAMDDWRAKPNLTVNLGIRYEISPPFRDKLNQLSVFRPGVKSRRFPNAPTGLLFVGDADPILGEVPRGGYPTDFNDIAPRVGIAWSPEPERGLLRTLLGERKTALRIGWGIFYDQTIGQSLSQSSATQPFSISQTITSIDISGPGEMGSFTDPFGNNENPWPINLSEGRFTPFPTVQPFDPDFRTAYSNHYNLTLQRELPWSLLVELAYVGSNSFKLNRERELNVARLTKSANILDLQNRRIFPEFSRIPSQESTGRARFDSFQIRVARRLKNGIKFDLSYVVGKSLDDGSGPFSSSVTDPFRWARSSFDRRHNFVMNYTYALPEIGNGTLTRLVFNGWQISGITEMRSGLPLDIFQNFDTTLTGRVVSTLGNPDLVGPLTKFDPRTTRTINVNGINRTGNFFLDPRAFRAVIANRPEQARAGTLGRNVIDGPGINITSLSIIKRLRFSESQRLDLRADVRNLFNRPHFQFDSLSLQVESGLFGQVTSTAPGRNIQLSVRYGF